VWTEHICVHAAGSLVSGPTASTGTTHLVHAYEINTIHIFKDMLLKECLNVRHRYDDQYLQEIKKVFLALVLMFTSTLS